MIAHYAIGTQFYRKHSFTKMDYSSPIKNKTKQNKVNWNKLKKQIEMVTAPPSKKTIFPCYQNPDIKDGKRQ